MRIRTLFAILVITLAAMLLTGCVTTITPVPAGESASDEAAAETPTEAALEETATITSEESSATPGAVGMPNPASENCMAQGGVLTIEKRGDGGEFGVCTFEDNRQCEEWALMRGQCPVGGIKVTGYLTPAARYCAITGGEYADNGTTSEEDEQGTCTFTTGASCPAADYYNGQCSP